MDYTIKKSESSLTADKLELSPFTAAVAFISREALPFNSGVPPVAIAISVGTKYIKN